MERTMKNSLRPYAVTLVFLSLLAFGAYQTKTQALASPHQAQPQYPILDMVASKVIQKYQSSTCEQLWEKKSAKTPPSAEEQKVVGLLKSDPQIRTVFIGKVAAPIANKMFECGMIP
jgi:hypothetical protein